MISHTITSDLMASGCPWYQGGWLKRKGGEHAMMPILLFSFPSVMQYYIVHNNNNATISGSKLLLAHLTKQ